MRRRAAYRGRLAWLLTVAIPYNREGCLDFPFPPSSDGYGQVRTGRGDPIRAARYVCMVCHGMPPTCGHEVAHSCGNKKCVNKRHLRWATHKENEADKIAHGTAPRGTNNAMAKLTDDKAQDIRLAKGTQRHIAQQFGITQATVSRVKARRTWAHKDT